MGKLEKRICDQYINRLKTKGQESLYRYIIGQCVINKNHNFTHPELIILQQSDYFFSQYRADGREINFIIGKISIHTPKKYYIILFSTYN